MSSASWARRRDAPKLPLDGHVGSEVRMDHMGEIGWVRICGYTYGVYYGVYYGYIMGIYIYTYGVYWVITHLSTKLLPRMILQGSDQLGYNL